MARKDAILTSFRTFGYDPNAPADRRAWLRQEAGTLGGEPLDAQEWWWTEHALMGRAPLRVVLRDACTALLHFLMLPVLFIAKAGRTDFWAESRARPGALHVRVYAWLAATCRVPLDSPLLGVATPLVVLAYLRGLSPGRFQEAFTLLAADRPAVALRALAAMPQARLLPPAALLPLLALPERVQRERVALLLADSRIPTAA